MSFIQPENATMHYISQMQNQFQELADRLHEHAHHVDDSQAKVMFEKSAQVLSGLVNVFSDFVQKNQSAWQDQQNNTK